LLTALSPFAVHLAPPFTATDLKFKNDFEKVIHISRTLLNHIGPT